jgi:hypothetical protein
LHTFFCAFSQNSQKHLGLRSVSLILHWQFEKKDFKSTL